MRTTPIYHPDRMPAAHVAHAYREGDQLHDDHAVTTLIIPSAEDAAHAHAHDDGLVHAHDWASATQAA